MEAVTDEQLAAGEKAMDPELSYLLSDRGVAKRTRGLIGHMGIHRMNVFAKIETNETEFRAWAKDSLGLNPAADPAARIALAILVDAWEASKNRITKQSELEAEARVLGIPKQSLKGTQLQLRKAYVQAFGPLPDKYCPSRTYVDWRLEQLEEGELRPEKLRQVTTVEDEDNDGEDGGTLDITKEGNIRFRKGRTSVAPPSTPEALRKFVRVMGVHWEFVRLKDPTRTFLQGHGMDLWNDYAEFLLGDDGWNLEARDGSGAVCARPTWLTLLSYEFEIRKAMCKAVNEQGCTLQPALTQAFSNVELRAKYFITPLAVSSRAEGSRHAGLPGRREDDNPRAVTGTEKAPQGAQPPRGNKKRKLPASSVKPASSSRPGPGEGSKYNQAKRQKGQGKGPDLHFLTPDKKRICYAYQKKACKRDQCTFAHVCAKCLGSHPFEDCPQA